MRVTDFKAGRDYALPESFQNWFHGKRLKIFEHDILLNVHNINRGAYYFNYCELQSDEWYEIRDESIESQLENAKKILIGLCYQFGKTTKNEKGDVKDIWHGFIGALEDAFEFLEWDDLHLVSEQELNEWLEF